MSNNECTNESSSDGDSSVGVVKRRKLCKESWKRVKVKEARLKGEEYVNSKGARVSAKQTGPPCR